MDKDKISKKIEELQNKADSLNKKLDEVSGRKKILEQEKTNALSLQDSQTEKAEKNSNTPDKTPEIPKENPKEKTETEKTPEVPQEESKEVSVENGDYEARKQDIERRRQEELNKPKYGEKGEISVLENFKNSKRKVEEYKSLQKQIEDANSFTLNYAPNGHYKLVIKDSNNEEINTSSLLSLYTDIYFSNTKHIIKNIGNLTIDDIKYLKNDVLQKVKKEIEEPWSRWVNDFQNEIDEINAKYDAELAELDRQFGKEIEQKEVQTEKTPEVKIEDENIAENQEEKEKQEKLNAIVELFILSVSKTNELKRRLAEIIEQENSTEENGDKEETQNLPRDGEPAVEGKTETREQIIEKMNGLRKNYNNNTKEIDKLRIELENLRDEKDKLKIWQFKKIGKKNQEIKEGTKELHLCIIEQEAQKEMFNNEDRKLFPFAYFVVDKIKNPTVRSRFERRALMVQKGIERKYLSLDDINNINYDFEIINPIEMLSKYYPDGFYNSYFDGNNNINFNIYGFCVESLNPETITEDGRGFKVLGDKINSPNAKYRVLDNNGRVIIENVNYENALNSFKEATEKYKKQVEEEFNKLNNNK